ncbi:MAG: SMC-Scp complex subunit ScpB [Anaerolineales bacterium]
MSESNLNSQKNAIKISLEAKVEALLFVAPSAAYPKQIADALEVTVGAVSKALDNLSEQLTSRGLRLQENKGRYQRTPAPELSAVVESFLHLEATSRLSPAALESLAIIAYQQPVTRPAIDAIRGVNSDSVLRTLLSKGLVEETGRSDGPGRPILYVTAPEFLQYFGLGSIKDLPPIDISQHKSSLVEDESPQPEQQRLPISDPLLKD